MDEMRMSSYRCMGNLFGDAYASGSVAESDGSGIYYPVARERAERLAHEVSQTCWELGKAPIEAVRLMAAAFSGAFGPLYVTYYPEGGPFCGLFYRSYVTDDPVTDCAIQNAALASGASLEGARYAFLNSEGVECPPLDVTPFGEEVDWWIKNSPDCDIAEVLSDLRERWGL